MQLTEAILTKLRARGVEAFHHPGLASFPDDAEFEPPCSIKWMASPYGFRIGAFSYGVSGHFARVRIGRYCSIGEQVQIGRSNHPLDWISTSPFFSATTELFYIGSEFEQGDEYKAYSAPRRSFEGGPPGYVVIGNDVWIGHGAFLRPGVTVGDGAVIGAMSVVTKNVAPYIVVAGNPAVVRRLRFPQNIAGPLLDLAWWRFAPWQLTNVDFTRPAAALGELRRIAEHSQPYAPETFRLTDLVK